MSRENILHNKSIYLVTGFTILLRVHSEFGFYLLCGGKLTAGKNSHWDKWLKLIKKPTDQLINIGTVMTFEQLKGGILPKEVGT